MTNDEKAKLFKLQLKKSDDVTECPSCGYIGWIDVNQRCSDELV